MAHSVPAQLVQCARFLRLIPVTAGAVVPSTHAAGEAKDPETAPTTVIEVVKAAIGYARAVASEQRCCMPMLSGLNESQGHGGSLTAQFECSEHRENP